MKISLGIVTVACLAVSLQAHAIINMGMAGDSLTDEYLASAPGDQSGLNLAAKSWVQILAQTRSANFNFGAYKPDPLNNWGGTRDTGYEYNYAKSGAVASNNTVVQLGAPGSTHVDFTQPITATGSSYLSAEINGDPALPGDIGLKGQISAGKVDTAFIGIGANDFLFRNNVFGYLPPYSSTPLPLVDLNLSAVVTDVTNGILAAVNTSLNAAPGGNLNLLVALVRPQSSGNDARAQAINTAVTAINNNLLAGIADLQAQGKHVASVDLWGWASDPNDPHHYNLDGTITIGGLTISPTAVSTDPLAGDLVPAGTPGASTTLCNAEGMCATEQNAMHFYTEPVAHPNTLIQGLLANQVIGALNDNFGAGIALLSDSELLAIPQYTPSVPVPASAWLFASGLLGLAEAKRRRR